MEFFSTILKKAGVVASDNPKFPNGKSLVEILQGDSAEQRLSPVDLIALNRHYVYISLSKNASTLASIPIKLYYNANKEIESTKHNSITSKQFKFIQKSAQFLNDIEVKQATEVVEITEHPLLNLLAHINDQMCYIDFAEIIQFYLGLIGNSYVLIEKQDDLPVALYPLLSEYITPIANNEKYGKILKYKYKVGSFEKDFDPSDIIHFLNYVPGSNLIGMGNVESCISAVQRYDYYDQYEKYLNKNNARPDFAVAYKNSLNEKDYKEVYKQWWKRFGSVRNSGKPIVTTGEYDIKQLGFAPREMAYSTGRDYAIREIINAFGVPESMVRLNDSNLASSLTAINQYLLFTIYPNMSRFLSKLNETLVPLYDKNLFLWFEQDMAEDPVSKGSLVISLTSAGIISKEEAREELGYDTEEVEEDEVEAGVEEDTSEANKPTPPTESSQEEAGVEGVSDEE